MIDEQSQEIVEIQQSSSNILNVAATLDIRGDADLKTAAEALQTIAAQKKLIESRRQFFVKPLNDQVKKINDLFKPIAAKLGEVDIMIRTKVNKYRSDQAAIAAKEQKRLDDLAIKQQARLDKKSEKTGVEAPKIIAPVVQPATTKVEGMTVRKTWTYEIVDEKLVPDDYYTIDPTKIRSAIKNEIREIPGIRIYQKEETVLS